MKSNTEKLDGIINFINEAFDDFPTRDNIDRKFFTYLMNDFESLDIQEELKQYYAWTLDRKPDARPLNHHSRFRQWLRRATLASTSFS